jgi:hypothetical protein
VAQFSEQAPSISETYDTQSRSLYANSKLLSLFISLEIDCFYSSVSTLDDTHVKRVSQRSAESRGFSPGTPVSSHREC